MRQASLKDNRPDRLSYFVFSIKYLVLIFLIYAALIAGPYAAVTHEWDLLFCCLSVILIGIRLLYVVLDDFFAAINKPGDYAYRMAIASIFPPVIGPVIVLLRSLE